MKKKLVILSAAAMVAAAAVPALAFENEFHGMYRLRANMTNFQAAGLAGIEGTQKTAAVAAVPASTYSLGSPAKAATYYQKSESLLAKDNRTFTVFEQRARLQYIAKANDDLKLVTHFEIDSSWGDAAYSNGRGVGAGLAGDTVNLETKNVYLDFNLPATPLNMKVGLQGFKDAYQGIFLYDDVAGAVATGKFGPVTATGAFFRTYDVSGAPLGKKDVDVYVLDGKFALNKGTNLGASYYYAFNDTNESGVGEAFSTHTLGLNAAANLGIVGLDAFVLYQTGDALYTSQPNKKAQDLSAWAAQIAAKANLGVATLRGAFLYASGDDGKDNTESNAYQNVAASGAAGNAPGSSVASGSYYSSQMLLLMRNIYNTDSDNALVASINNKDHGLMLGVLGADIKVNDKFSASVNVGTAYNAEKRGTEKDDYIGTEVNLNLNYKLYPNLTATLQGAYVMLGDIYDGAAAGSDPEDPYLTGLMLNYTF